jgi:hypothetical protein
MFFKIVFMRMAKKNAISTKENMEAPTAKPIHPPTLAAN